MVKKIALLMVTICALCLVTEMSVADPGIEVKGVWVEGKVTTKAYSVKNYKGSGVLDQYVLNRALISLGVNPADGISGRLLFADTRVWGKSVSTFQEGEPGASEFLTGSGGLLENIGVFNAYLKVKDVLWGIDLTMGRQFAGDEEDAFFFYGPQQGRLLGITSIDAVKGEWTWGPVDMIGLAGKKAEVGLGDGSGRDPAYPDSVVYVKDQDVNIYALRAKSTTLVPGQTFDLDLYSRRRGLSQTDKVDDLMLLVLRSRGNISLLKGLEYDAMLGLNGGKNEETDQTYNGWLGRGIGYYTTDVPSICGLKLTGGYVYVSGDKASTSDKDEHFARISRDCFYSMATIVYEILNDSAPEKVTNVTIPFGGLEIVPKAFGGKMTLKAMACKLGCAEPIAGYDKKGSEVDLSLRYAPRDNLSLGIVWAKFKPEGILEANWGSDPTTQLTGELTVKF